MMYTIEELLTAIDAWRAAEVEYDAAYHKSPDRGTRERQQKIFALDHCAYQLTETDHNKHAMANFVTLADEIRRLRELEHQLVIETARSIAFEKRIAELEAALEWYADKVNYRAIEATHTLYLPAVHTDKGERARKALGLE